MENPAHCQLISIMAMDVAPKQDMAHVEDASATHDTFKLDEIHDPINLEEERRLVRKIDWIILPCLSVCYIFFYVSHQSF